MIAAAVDVPPFFFAKQNKLGIIPPGSAASSVVLHLICRRRIFAPASGQRNSLNKIPRLFSNYLCMKKSKQRAVGEGLLSVTEREQMVKSIKPREK